MALCLSLAACDSKTPDGVVKKTAYLLAKGKTSQLLKHVEGPARQQVLNESSTLLAIIEANIKKDLSYNAIKTSESEERRYYDAKETEYIYSVDVRAQGATVLNDVQVRCLRIVFYPDGEIGGGGGVRFGDGKPDWFGLLGGSITFYAPKTVCKVIDFNI